LTGALAIRLTRAIAEFIQLLFLIDILNFLANENAYSLPGRDNWIETISGVSGKKGLR
jgi:hypothetical protein